MIPIILLNLFIGFLGRGFIDNAAHLGGLLSGAVLAVAVDYQRPGVRRSVTTAWRVLQILSLSIVVVGFYKVVRNFNRPLPVVARAVPPSPNALMFLNYVNAMNQVQEKVAAVIHKNDLTDIALITDRALQAPVPDAQAAELRARLLEILSKLAGAAAQASPSPNQEPGRPAQLDQKLVDDYYNWRKEYDQWLKHAVKTYTGPS